MKTFKQFMEEVPVNSVSAGGVANYEPVMKFKMFRRKRKEKKA